MSYCTKARIQPLRFSDRTSSASPGNLSGLRQRSSPRSRAPQLPHNVLATVFAHVREVVTLKSTIPLWGELQDAKITVGPLIQITMVSWFWREVALSSPSLWSAIPVLVESGKLLSLANPQQVRYCLQLAKETPLKLIIGTRKELGGPGVKYQRSLTYHPLDFLAELAPRVSELAIAFQPNSNLLPVIRQSPHDFLNLEALILIGSPQPASLLEQAGFWGCTHLRQVLWGFSYQASPPPFLSSPSPGLTVVLLTDNWDATLPSATVHAFLGAASGLVEFRVRVCHSHGSADSDSPNSQPLLLLHHDKLQKLSIIFQGHSPDSSSAPLISALRTPGLKDFSFDLDWSTNVNPSAVTKWLCISSGCSLSTFECLARHIDRADLLLCLRAMPLLEVFKCTGAVLGDRRFRLAAVDTEKALIDERLLMMLAVGVLQQGLSKAEKIPCPLLREFHVENTYFSRFHLDAFILGRLYGGTRFLPNGNNVKVTPLRKIVIVDLIDRLGGDVGAGVFKARRFMQKWKALHDVEVSVSRFIDKHRLVVAGLEDMARPL